MEPDYTSEGPYFKSNRIWDRILLIFNPISGCNVRRFSTHDVFLFKTKPLYFLCRLCMSGVHNANYQWSAWTCSFYFMKPVMTFDLETGPELYALIGNLSRYFQLFDLSILGSDADASCGLREGRSNNNILFKEYIRVSECWPVLKTDIVRCVWCL